RACWRHGLHGRRGRERHALPRAEELGAGGVLRVGSGGGDFPDLVAVRTTRPLAAPVPALRAASHDVNPAIVVWKAQTMDQLLDAPLAQPRLSALLLSGFSVVSLLLFGV